MALGSSFPQVPDQYLGRGGDGFDHAEGLGVGGDFVDAVDVGALFAEPGGEGDGGPVAVGDAVEAGEEGEHGFAGDADEEGAVGDAEVG